MEKEPNPNNKQEAIIAHIKELTAQYPFEINNCQKQSGDSWLNCCGSCLAASSFYIQSKESYLTPDDYNKYMLRIKTLFDKIEKLKQEYPDKKTELPEDLKQELLADLDITKEN